MDCLVESKGYDETNAKSIEAYAKKMINKTFRNILDMDSENHIEDSSYAKYSNKNAKGELGKLIEKHYFHYKPNNDPRPDFPEAGCELKVTPCKKNTDGSYSAKERLSITQINYFDLIDVTFEKSHFWEKASLLLLVYYLHDDKSDKLDYLIKYVQLFTPPTADLEIIKQDYLTIQKKVKAGLAHELSGSDTLYLEAAPKSTTVSNKRNQPNSDIPARYRGFAFKTSYMNYVLNNYIIGKNTAEESIIKDSTITHFERYIKKKIAKYKNKSVEELCSKFNVSFEKPPKNLGALLAYRILGIKGNKASEFKKAGIVVKTITINSSNHIEQHMSFPSFKFEEIVKETWNNSSFRNYLSSTRFFFIVYKYDESNTLRLKGCQFWNIPYYDLETDVKKVWNKTRKIIKKGIEFSKEGKKTHNNLPSSTENKVCHVRPHGRNKEDTYPLPNGGSFTKQCFWLNNSYILEQIDDKLKQ